MNLVMKLLLGRLLSDNSFKTFLLKELRELALETEGTTIDDKAVNVVEAVWDSLVVVLVGKR